MIHTNTEHVFSLLLNIFYLLLLLSDNQVPDLNKKKVEDEPELNPGGALET